VFFFFNLRFLLFDLKIFLRKYNFLFLISKKKFEAGASREKATPLCAKDKNNHNEQCVVQVQQHNGVAFLPGRFLGTCFELVVV